MYGTPGKQLWARGVCVTHHGNQTHPERVAISLAVVPVPAHDFWANVYGRPDARHRMVQVGRPRLAEVRQLQAPFLRQ